MINANTSSQINNEGYQTPSSSFDQLALGRHASISYTNNLDIANSANNAKRDNNNVASDTNATKPFSAQHALIQQRWYSKLLALPAYYWVIISQVVVILPHAAHLPLWLIGFAMVSIIAQLPAIKSKFKNTSQLKRVYRSVQMLGFLLGLIGLWLTYNTAFGLDMGVAFLVLCLVSKLWELYKRRDAYVALNLSFFVLAALLLMSQGLLTTLEVVIGTILILFAFIALNDDSNVQGDGRLRTLGVLAIAAVPLLIVLFLFFPRLPPLWSVQLSGQQATTGVSDSMSPGDFANLGQSTELAFRVEFDNGRPLQSEMYWRGLVFSDFDGVTWRPNQSAEQWPWALNEQQPEWIKQALATATDKVKLAPTNYEMILEPTQQRWLFGLDYPFAQDQGIRITSNFTLLKDQPVTQQLRYDVLQYAPMSIDPILEDQMRRINLALPSSGNPQARALAKQLFAQSDSDPVRYMSAIERWINQTEFHYTLSPPKLNNDRIDSFLFETKAGFCEHYSSSFTFMLRAAGIPARVVAGYQGGEVGRSGNVWEVRQMDAHAWTEVWLDGQGWVRVDPTAFVAPERVEQGMDAMTQSQGAAIFGEGAGAQISYQQYQMLQSLRRLSDQASYYWQKDIVGYDQDKQAGALLKWFNIQSVMQQILWFIGVAIIVIGAVIGFIWQRRRKRWHPADLPLHQLSYRLGKYNNSLVRIESEGQLAWLERLSENLPATGSINSTDNNSTDNKTSGQLATKHQIQEIKHSYRQLRYGRLSDDMHKSRDYQQLLNKLKLQIKVLLKNQ